MGLSQTRPEQSSEKSITTTGPKISVISLTPKPAPSGGSATQSLAAEDVLKRFAIRRPSDLRQRCSELRTGDDLVRSFLPAGCLALLVGDSGLGKSSLVYSLSLSVAAGKPFLGYRTRQGRVLYLDFENGLAQVDTLIRQLARHLQIDLSGLSESLLLWNFNDAASDWRESTTSEMVRNIRPHLLVIDSLNSYYPEAEEKNFYAVRVLKDLRSSARECQCTILLVHHIRKPSSKPDERPLPLEKANLRQWFLQARGGRALINGTDVRVGVDEPAAGQEISRAMAARGLAEGGSNTLQRALVLRGFSRVRGEIPLIHIGRVLDDDGEPLGYERITGADLLPGPQREKFDALPKAFRFKSARQIYCKGDQATTDFLNKCLTLGVLERVGRLYRKVVAE